MPVVGLPAAVEGTLEALLTEHQRSSWKVSSEGPKTVVPRLTALTSVAEHTTHSRTVQQFRRKPPSQQNRAKKRVEEYNTRLNQQKVRQTSVLQHQQASDLTDSGFELFATTPEYCQHEHKYRDVHNTSQHELSARGVHSLESATSVFARAATYSDNDSDTQGREDPDSVVAAGCVDSQSRSADPHVSTASAEFSETELECGPTDNNTQNTRNQPDPRRENSTTNRLLS